MTDNQQYTDPAWLFEQWKKASKAEHEALLMLTQAQKELMAYRHQGKRVYAILDPLPILNKFFEGMGAMLLLDISVRLPDEQMDAYVTMREAFGHAMDLIHKGLTTVCVPSEPTPANQETADPPIEAMPEQQYAEKGLS